MAAAIVVVIAPRKIRVAGLDQRVPPAGWLAGTGHCRSSINSFQPLTQTGTGPSAHTPTVQRTCPPPFCNESSDWPH